jgi:hypothetical protein
MPDWFQLSGCAGTEADGARARANAAITLIKAVKMKSFISITSSAANASPPTLSSYCLFLHEEITIW